MHYGEVAPGEETQPVAPLVGARLEGPFTLPVYSSDMLK